MHAVAQLGFGPLSKMAPKATQRATSAPAAPKASVLSEEEREAETLFREAMHRRVSPSEAVIRASELEKRSTIAVSTYDGCCCVIGRSY